MKDLITSDELLAQISAMKTQLLNSPLLNNYVGNQGMFHGMPIIEHQPTFEPKLQIDPKFKHCSDKFRNRMNVWLWQRFGAWDKTAMKPYDTLVLNNRIIIARPETASILRTIG